MALYSDSFTRADTAAGSGLGFVPSGPAWEIVNGSWQILSGRAYTSTSRTSNPIAVVSGGSGDVDISANVSSSGGDAIYFRVVDSNDWLRARVRRYQTSSSYTTYTTEYEWVQHYFHAEPLDHDTGWYSNDAEHSMYKWGTYSTAPSFPSVQMDYHSHNSQGSPSDGTPNASPGTHSHYIYKTGLWKTGATRQVATGTGTSYTNHYQIILEKSVNGTVTTLGTYTTSAPSSLRVRAVENNIKVYVSGNATVRIDVNDATHQNAAKHGIGRGASDLDGQALDNVTIDTLNSPPTAPISLTPASAAVLDRNTTQRFSWTPTDPDSGDTQSKYDLQYRVVGASTWTVVTGTKTASNHDFAAGTFAAGDYEWQVRTYDSGGLVGPYSASAFFTAANPPTGPTFTSPINGSTVSTSEATVSWSAPNQDAYELRRVADNAGAANPSTVYYTTGVVESSSVRSTTIPFETNLRTEHVQIRIRHNSLWSTWSSVQVNVSYTPPATPTIVVTPNGMLGYIQVNTTHPVPTGTEPIVNSTDVWVRVAEGGRPDIDRTVGDDGIRIAADLSGESFLDRAASSGVEYEYRVRANGDNGTSSWSEWTA